MHPPNSKFPLTNPRGGLNVTRSMLSKPLTSLHLVPPEGVCVGEFGYPFSRNTPLPHFLVFLSFPPSLPYILPTLASLLIISSKEGSGSGEDSGVAPLFSSLLSWSFWGFFCILISKRLCALPS